VVAPRSLHVGFSPTPQANPNPDKPAVQAEPAKAETIGKPTEYGLDNGLRVRLVPTAGEKQAVLLLGVRAGLMEEPAGLPHLAHVTEHLAVQPAKSAK
jgi:predicted Zn-dependent peptidase